MKKINYKIILLIAYFIFLGISYFIDFEPGSKALFNMGIFLKDMVIVVPCAFILIGLFDVWVKKETVEKHLGDNSGILSFVWAILLAGTTVGGLYVAFPVAYMLLKKGARFSMIFTYLGASSICRVPMTLFEISFMGIKFTLIRLLVSLPIVITFAICMEIILKKKNYQIVKKDTL